MNYSSYEEAKKALKSTVEIHGHALNLDMARKNCTLLYSCHIIIVHVRMYARAHTHTYMVHIHTLLRLL